MSKAASYKDGYIEGAIFLFYDDGDILIEHRPTAEGTETFIPNGTVEERDKVSEYHDDHIVAGLLREVNEEFQGQVTVTSFDKLCEYRVEDPAIWFHAYVVTEWEGELPEYTVEDGDRYADLEWVPLDAYDDYLSFQSAVATCKQLRRYVDSDGN